MSIEHKAIYGIGIQVDHKYIDDIGDKMEYFEGIVENTEYRYSCAGNAFVRNPDYEFFLFLEDDKIDEGIKDRLDKLVADISLDESLKIIGKPGLIGTIDTY